MRPIKQPVKANILSDRSVNVFWLPERQPAHQEHRERNDNISVRRSNDGK